MIKVHLSGGVTLNVINTIVAQLETADGPLTSISVESRGTILMIDDEQPKPAHFAVVQPGTGAPPANSSLLFTGRVAVSGELHDCIVYRPKA